MQEDGFHGDEANEEEDAATAKEESSHRGIVAYDARDGSPASSAGTDGE